MDAGRICMTKRESFKKLLGELEGQAWYATRLRRDLEEFRMVSP